MSVTTTYTDCVRCRWVLSGSVAMLVVDSRRAFAHVTEQQVEDAAFLWLLWDRSANQPHQTVLTRAKLERRIAAHLSGMSFSPDIAWQCAEQTAEQCDAGELFVLAMLALSGSDSRRVQRVVEIAKNTPHAERGLISALGWLPNDRVYPWLKPWVTSDDIHLRYLAITACSVRRLDPEAYLTRMLNDPLNQQSRRLYARLLRLVGELKRADLRSALAPVLTDEGDLGFWANWSATLLGERRTTEALRSFVMAPGDNRSRATELAFRVQSGESAWAWLNPLILAEEDSVVIQALGALGDPRGINWLLTRMEEPALAKPAAEAFALITGADLEAENLTRPPPDASLDSESASGLDYDHCPFPCIERVSAFWNQVRSRFRPGQRYLLGYLVAEAPLEHLWRSGRQPQRCAAALEGALTSPAFPYANARAPSFAVGAS